jgi:hypothetical protein
MILFQTYSCVSQTIIVNNKWICFDEKAALELEHQNKARIVLDSVQNKLVEVLDSSMQNKNQQIKALSGIVKGYEYDNLSLQSQMIQTQKECKKGKLRSFIVGAGAGSIIALLLVIIL